MSGMNHLRFECGVDLKALWKVNRRQMLKEFWSGSLNLGDVICSAAH